METTTTADYRILKAPDLPAGWLFCARCGSQMTWRTSPSAGYDRKTGQPNTVTEYVCSSKPDPQFEVDHDRIRSGEMVIGYYFE